MYDTKNGSTSVIQDDARKTKHAETKSNVSFYDINETDTINKSISVIQYDIIKTDTV
jgi:hypothetical protein